MSNYSNHFRPAILITLTSSLVLSSSFVFSNEVLDRLATFRDTPTNKHEQLVIDPTTTEQFDPNTGTISFEAVDISLPGNFDIPVEVRRVYKPGSGGTAAFWPDRHYANYAGDSLHSFGKRSGNVASHGPNLGGYGGTWSLDLPYVKGFFIQPLNGSVQVEPGGWKDGNVCSEDYTQAYSTGFNGSYTETSPITTSSYWQGKQLHIPGKVSEPFINSTQYFSANSQVTKSNYKISSCFSIGNGNEGIRVKGPGGLIYEFGHYLDFVDTDRLPLGVNFNKVRRHVMVTKVTDPFGNYVNYNWQGQRLTSITSSDNRTITFGYGASNNITSATANGKTWTYLFNEGDLKVTSPEGRIHDYKTRLYIKNLAYAHEHLEPGGTGLPSSNTSGNCEKNTNSPAVSFQVKLPSGATVSYTLEATYHGKSRTRPINELTGKEFFGPISGGFYDTNLFFNPSNLKCSVFYSLKRKSIYGPNMDLLTWNYEYSENEGSYKADYDSANTSQRASWSIPNINIPSTVTNLYDYKTTRVIGPDSVIEYFINRKQDTEQEGQVVGVNTYEANGTTLVKQVKSDYSTLQSIGNGYWPSHLNSSSPVNQASLNTRVLNKKTTTTYYLADGNDNYYIDNEAYDVTGNLIRVKEHNSFNSNVRYHVNGYMNSPSDWRFGILTSKAQGPSTGNLKETMRIEYHSVSNTGLYSGKFLPYKVFNFGRWQYLYPTYHSDGNVRRVEINAKLVNSAGTPQSQNRFVELNDYYRGNARIVTLPSRYNHQSIINSEYGIDYFGNLTSYSDFNGNTVQYKYDDDGFLKAKIPSYLFNSTYVNWSVDSNGGWVRTAYECATTVFHDGCEAGSEVSSNSIVYDGLYRPIKSINTDIGSSKSTYQHYQYDSRNNKLFTSVPSFSASDMVGESTIFDALSRPTSFTQIGGRVSSYIYSRNNTTSVSNARGYTTTTQYLAYGSPTQLASVISSPESVTTNLSYDILDNVKTITQTGPGKQGEPNVFGIEQHYYNDYNQLCMTSRADTGNIVYSRNAMGEVTGQKLGSLSNTTCTLNNAGVMPKFILDNHGSVMEKLYWGDGPDTRMVLDENGNVREVNQSTGITTYYTYNSLNMMESERLVVQGKVLNLGYEYNPSGQIERITYPNDDVIEYKYNGFGQQISVRRLADSNHSAFTYAQQAEYYANGTIKQFKYGNDIIHSRTLNSRFLPEDVKDVKSSMSISSLSYQYDNNNNVSQIVDRVDSRYSLNLLSYDGLDRLTNISGGYLMGNTNVAYDGLGNITRYVTKNSTLDYVYDRTSNRNRLLRVNGSGSDSKSYSQFLYDDAGNVTNNGHHSFVYNGMNQMSSSGSFSYLYDGYGKRVKKVDSTGSTYSMYSNFGKLMYLESANDGTNHIYLNGNIIARDGSERSENGRQHFNAFGESIEGATENVGYTGHMFDTALDLQYMQARYYDPVIGRFYSNDPVGYISENPVMSFNRYLYVNNNPYKYTDPNGMVLQAADENERQYIADQINSRSKSQYEFDKYGNLTKTDAINENGSESYSDAINTIIGSEDVVTVDVPTQGSASESYINDFGGGATMRSQQDGGSIVYITGQSIDLPNKNGGTSTLQASDILAHELTDHARPHIQGMSGTGYKGLNKVRRQNNLPEIVKPANHID